ncbi:MAG: bifunctional folylpolyglutamate synthase/dihydrofolate synthase [Syntrophaceae bacterium]|nr:bifunctional folylpolyglutamate synthase/dihydrofolate synthase [Syntrophaceae bacterium]
MATKSMNKIDPAAYITSLNIDVMHFGLTAISELLSRLGNPQNSYKTILIAGTNGKGSTAAMTASILQAAGYKTGLYTSPHLIDVRERISVNKKQISAGDFGRIISAVKKKIEQPVTYFELLTAAAFLYFQHRKIDIAVLETGLGGRLDATNVCQPLVSVITNIAFDHTAYLGKTLTAIAREKAGIIKQQGVCITAAKQKKVIEVLENVCRSNKADLYRMGKDIKIRQQENGLVAYSGLYSKFYDLTVPLTGRHQLDNAALALAALEIAGLNGFPVDAASVRKGLRNTKWNGRLEILCREPLFVVDGAHNPAGINALCRSLKNDFTYSRLIFIFSALADKDYRKMLEKIVPLADQIILTQLQAGRAVPVATINEYVKKLGYRAVITENVSQSMERALEMADRRDMICAAGSLYLVGEIKQAFPEVLSYGKKLELK